MIVTGQLSNKRDLLRALRLNPYKCANKPRFNRSVAFSLTHWNW
jgi:hypothetical protein